MSPRSSRLVLLLLACSTTTLLCHLATAQPLDPGAGGWTRIKNVDKDYHVGGIADFAVSEHNKQTGQNLTFVRIIRAEVDRRYYRVIIQANDRVRKLRYEAVVWEMLWDKIRELVSFKLLA